MGGEEDGLRSPRTTPAEEVAQVTRRGAERLVRVLLTQQQLLSARSLPWLLLCVTGMILGWYQVKVATLARALQEREQVCGDIGLEGAKTGPGEEEGADYAGASPQSISVEEELDALYKQLNEQTVELHACRKENAQLIEARRTANFATTRAHVDVAQDGWVFHQGMDFDGFNLMRKPALRDKPNLLVAAARGAAGTVAVNTNGWLKSGVAPIPKWYRWTDDIAKGVYVRADVVVPEERR